MKNICHVFMTGRVAHTPELKALPNGTSILEFSTCWNTSKQNQNQEWEDIPNFIDCALLGKLGESLARYLTKGMKITIEGILRHHKWQAADGTNRQKHSIMVTGIELPPSQTVSQVQPTATTPPDTSIYDEEIPF